MLESPIPEALTFDDVLLLPSHSRVLPSEADPDLGLAAPVGCRGVLRPGPSWHRGRGAAPHQHLDLVVVEPVELRALDGVAGVVDAVPAGGQHVADAVLRVLRVDGLDPDVVDLGAAAPLDDREPVGVLDGAADFAVALWPLCEARGGGLNVSTWAADVHKKKK